jgi:3-deoxy-D-manno-octulosonic-acid transferase
VGYLCMLPRFVVRMWRRGGYGPGFMERFGCYPAAVAERVGGRSPLWIHAVSVGEVAVAGQFMRALRAALPDASFVLTVTTSTGRAVAGPHMGERDVLLYFPVDFPWVVRRVVRQLRPAALILTEGELWPNLIRLLARRGIPVVVVNGRLSSASARGYRLVRWFFRDIVNRVSVFLVQAAVDRERLVALGAAPARVHVVGSAKYEIADAPDDAVARAWAILAPMGIGPEQRLIVGGSTWPGEEEALLAAWQRIHATHSRVRLVLVPRHAERRQAVEGVLRAAGVRYARRTAPQRLPEGESADVVLVDSTGELTLFYAVADVIFVGKSLGDNRGGQNFIEPAVFSKPIIVGPHIENFPAVGEAFEAAEAFVQVADAAALEQALRHLLEDRAAAAALGARAGALVAGQRGAIARSLELLLPLLEPARR